MPLDTAHKSFVVNRASGVQSVAGIGISGKAYIFYGANTSGQALSYTDGYWIGMGFAESMSSGNSIVSQAAIASFDTDNIATTQAGRYIGISGAIAYCQASGLLPQRLGSLTSINGDGFDVNWYAIDTGSGKAISGYIQTDVFGGADIVNAKVSTFTALSGHGNQTVSGFGFSGNLLFMFQDRSDMNSLDVTGLGFGLFSFGMASTNGQGAVAIHCRTNVGTADTFRWQRNDRCLIGMALAGTAANQASFVGFTNDGFTLNWISGMATTTEVLCLLLKISGNVKIGSFNMVSGTGNMSTSGVGFSGKHLMMFSAGTAANNVAVSSGDARLSIGGAASSTQRGGIWIGSEAGAAPTANARVTVSGTMLVTADENDVGSSTTTQLDCDFVSFHSDGFTLNRNTNTFTADASGISILYAVIGQVGNVVEETIQPKAYVVGPSFDAPQSQIGFQPNNLPPIFGMNLNTKRT